MTKPPQPADKPGDPPPPPTQLLPPMSLNSGRAALSKVFRRYEDEAEQAQQPHRCVQWCRSSVVIEFSFNKCFLFLNLLDWH
ncbi:hypothetical protein INR49_007549 [Caranx melampygus]|nr:hypothetical protein INR49_007549 [Caranx melampygus]